MATKKRKKKAKTHAGAGGADRTITIQVNGGVFSYLQAPGNNDGKHVHAEPSDTVKWRCPGHAFMILFAKNGSPFDGVVFGGLASGTSASGIVLPGPGTYAYLVVVVTNTGVLIDDPDIIVT